MQLQITIKRIDPGLFSAVVVMEDKARDEKIVKLTVNDQYLGTMLSRATWKDLEYRYSKLFPIVEAFLIRTMLLQLLAEDKSIETIL